MKLNHNASLIIPNSDDVSDMEAIEVSCSCGSPMRPESVDLRYVEGTDRVAGEIRSRIRIRFICDNCQRSEGYRVAVIEDEVKKVGGECGQTI